MYIICNSYAQGREEVRFVNSGFFLKITRKCIQRYDNDRKERGQSVKEEAYMLAALERV